MSFAGQVLWKRSVVVWAVDTIGKPSAAVPAVAAAAVDRNLRRVGAASLLLTKSMIVSLARSRLTATRRAWGHLLSGAALFHEVAGVMPPSAILLNRPPAVGNHSGDSPGKCGPHVGFVAAQQASGIQKKPTPTVNSRSTRWIRRLFSTNTIR